MSRQSAKHWQSRLTATFYHNRPLVVIHYLFLSGVCIVHVYHDFSSKSIVWEYFEIDGKEESKGECLVCKSSSVRSLLSQGRKQKNNFASINLK
jgi:hypothetical protein